MYKKFFHMKNDDNKKANNSNTDDALLSDLTKNLEYIKKIIGNSYDVVIRTINLPFEKNTNACIIFVNGLVDKKIINEDIIRPLLNDIYKKEYNNNLINFIDKSVINNLETKLSSSWHYIVDKLYSGETVLLIDRYSEALILDTRNWNDRGIQEAKTEQSIIGPKDSFTETLLVNTMLLRRKIKTTKLRIEKFTIGRQTKTDVVISYIDGVAKPKLITEVTSRLKRIDTDSILNSNMVQEYIEDSSFSPIPQFLTTERPDKVAAHILEGGVAIIIDGSPFALLLPIVFWKFLFATDDYCERLYNGIFIRSLRLFCLIASLTLPSFYIAILSFHHEMIPTPLMQLIAETRRQIPFPILVEILIMELVIEVIREAGIRLPQNVGQAISIVGALVLGQAALQAKLAGPATVTIVSFTAIASFTLPTFSAALSVRVLRFPLIFFSGLFGIFGFIATLFVYVTHLCSLRSFGVPFMAPFAPLMPENFSDSFIRMPFWGINNRPTFLGPINLKRQKTNQKPGLEQKGSGEQEVRNN